MDPELIRQLNEQLSLMTELLGAQNTVISNQIKATVDATNSLNKKTEAAKKSTTTKQVHDNAVTGNIKKNEALAKANEISEAASMQFTSSVKQGQAALLNFASSVLDANPGMSKYASGVSGLASATSGLLTVFGPLGRVLGVLVGAVGQLAGSSFKYLDNVVSAYDTVAKAGASIGTSAEGFVALGKNANLSSQTLALMAKGIQDLDASILNLGNTTSGGVQTFGQVIAVGDKNLQRYRNLGYTQDELIEAQTTYLKLQAQTGAQMRESPEKLQKASMGYIDQLNILAELTGISAKKQQELLEQAQAQENFNAHIADLERDKAAATTEAEKEQIQKVIDAKKEYATFAETLDPNTTKALLETISTKGDPIITESNAQLRRVAPEVFQQARDLNRGVNRTGELMQTNRDMVRRFENQYGELGTALGESSRNLQQINMVGNNAREQAARFGGKSAAQFNADRAAFAKQQEEKKNQQKGIVAQRGQIESQERSLRLTFDSVLEQLAGKMMDMVLKFIPMVTKALSFINMNMPFIENSAKALGIGIAVLAGAAGIGKLFQVGKSLKDSVFGIFSKQPKGEPGSSKDNLMHIKLSGDNLGKLSGMPDLHRPFNTTDNEPTGGKKRRNKIVSPSTSIDQGETKDAGFLSGIVDALKSAGKAAPMVIAGAAALAAAITELGAGIAGATWIMGKALPTFAEGMKKFNEVDGQNLKGLGIGLAGFGAGVIAIGAGTVTQAIGNIVNYFTGGDDPLTTALEMLKKMQSWEIDRKRVEDNGSALIAFTKTMAAITALNVGTGAISTIKGIATGLASWFSGQKPYEELEDFSKLNINLEKVKNNSKALELFGKAMSSFTGSTEGARGAAIAEAATEFFNATVPMNAMRQFGELKVNSKAVKKNSIAFKHFAEAIASFKGFGGSGTAIATTLADATVKFFKVKPPLEQFVYFSHLDINQKKAKVNSKSFVLFSEAMASYKGGEGLLDAVSTIAGAALNKLFGEDSAIDTFYKFSRMDFGKNAEKNAKAFLNFSKAMGILSGGSSSFDMGAGLGAGLLGAVAGAGAAAISLVGDALGLSAPGPDSKILNFIGKVESGNNYNKLVGGKIKNDPPLTDMTVAQVMAFQDTMRARGHETTALGKYQIIKGTLAGIVKSGAISPNDKFNALTQDKAAIHLMNMRGREKYKSGKITQDMYANNLAKEWASMPMPDGNSFYAGKGSNKSLVPRSDFMKALQARKGGMFSGPTGGYPMVMHGTEIIIPANANSILTELAKESTENPEEILSMLHDKLKPISGKTQTGVSVDKIVDTDYEMREMLLRKISKALEIVKDSTDTSEKMLRHARS